MTERRAKAKRMRRQRDGIARILERFDDAALVEVERRADADHDQGPDGYPATSTGAPSRSSDETSSTERQALFLVDGKRPLDVQRIACERIDRAFQSAWDSIVAAERAWDLILHVSDSLRERSAQSTLGSCLACLRDDIPNIGNDRIRAGYCVACFSAWERTRDAQGLRQDRRSFELARRELHLVEDETGQERTRRRERRGQHRRSEPDAAV